MKILSKQYRVETKWPTTSWRYTPERDQLTAQEAIAIQKSHKVYQKDGMKQRIVCTTEAIVKF